MKFPWSLEPSALTPRFWSALVAWQKKSVRAVDVKLESDQSLSIFCYDHKVMEGKFVRKISEIPTTKSLMFLKKKTVERERAELSRKLDQLEE